MKNTFQSFGIVGVVVILLCTGIFLYSEWDLRQFKMALRESSTTVPYTQRTKDIEKAEAPSEPTVSPPLEVNSEDSQLPTGIENSGTDLNDASEFVERTSQADLDFFVEHDEEVADDPRADAFTEDAEDLLSDEEIITAGFDDYNASLSSDPEYAYQRLDDAFRTQYGDSPDVDIIIRSIRRSNEGTATINDAIENTEAFLRLASQISPEEGLQPIKAHLDTLRETRQLALEEGTELPRYQETHIFDPSR